MKLTVNKLCNVTISILMCRNSVEGEQVLQAGQDTFFFVVKKVTKIDQ